jgi:uncharacterized protein (TIGR03118 family)
MHRRLGWIGAFAAAALLLSYPLQASAHDRDGGRHGGGGGGKRANGPTVTQTNLVADQAGAAAITDPNLVNPWGLSHGPNTPLWVSDNVPGVSTLYTTATPPVAAVPLVVATPGGGPTGQVFNDTTGFTVPGTGAPAAFIFVGVGGDLTAWNGSLKPNTSAVLMAHTPGAEYTGLALAHSPFGPLLLAADFHDGRIDVFDSSFRPVDVNLLFRDRYLPRGYAPFNITEIGSRVYVTYAKQDAAGAFDVPGRGHGFVDVFTNYGVLLHRLVSRGDLNSPWGLTLAPSTFGRFAGKLLVGNFGDGRIHVYDPMSGRELGTVLGANHRPLAIDGLWGLIPGDATAGGPDAVWFSAGPDHGSHGLLGTLTAK